jgi:hypothetical protein
MLLFKGLIKKLQEVKEQSELVCIHTTTNHLFVGYLEEVGDDYLTLNQYWHEQGEDNGYAIVPMIVIASIQFNSGFTQKVAKEIEKQKALEKKILEKYRDNLETVVLKPEG